MEPNKNKKPCISILTSLKRKIKPKLEDIYLNIMVFLEKIINYLKLLGLKIIFYSLKDANITVCSVFCVLHPASVIIPIMRNNVDKECIKFAFNYLCNTDIPQEVINKSKQEFNHLLFNIFLCVSLIILDKFDAITYL